ncbi:MAG TPA: hypothetical protein VMM78_03580 [Thermomicrobiales bacterium]|nr:hypothetical protein [Thermomicrobiales bacterium]
MSKPTKSRSRGQLSRAEIKAYEARRAAQRSQSPVSAAHVSSTEGTTRARRARSLSREEEFAIIKADMKRLVVILAILLVILVAVTIVLR